MNDEGRTNYDPPRGSTPGTGPDRGLSGTTGMSAGAGTGTGTGMGTDAGRRTAGGVGTGAGMGTGADFDTGTDALPPAGQTSRTRYDADRDEGFRSVRSVDDFAQQVRANPLQTLAVAVGAGLVLHKTGLLGSVVSSTARRSSSDYSPEEERLLAWLNDAYALEKAQIPVLENHADDARDFPEVRRKDLEHLEKTRRHAKQVRECIEHLGAKPSKVKAAIGRVSGALNSMTTEPFDDEVVRNFLQDFAAENLEIASYEAIIAAAEVAGHPKIARICEEILADEEEMVDWLRDNLPRVVRRTLVEL